ncbi:MAG: efflux RND transporter periplasmic adaptor subunit, partial [Gemmatimonadetes bacterium]|nr:efflux RND transporter periplasmic adaptor subunit [Gemmatimonadota bacterium]
ERILARRRADEAGSGGSERAARNARERLDAARRRLRYWDIPDAEIERIEASGQPVRTLDLRAPAGGVVVEKLAVAGARIMPGMNLYRIAGLSRVWVAGEVVEKDVALVHVGQSATASLDAYPGESFAGRVTYLYPTLDADSRTGRVRVEIANPGQRLKPGMYARLTLDASSPRAALLVPRTAIHFTGQRALAFVRHKDGTLMPHEVTAGLASGDSIEVLAGLSEGMQVVNSASFLIDAESNLGTALAAMPGMNMAPEAAPATGPAPTGHEGHTMPMPAPAPAPAPTGHEGHTMPMPAPAPAPAKTGHEGHTMPTPQAPADPHAAHRRQQ